MGDGRGLADDPPVQGGFAGISFSDGRGRAVTPKAGGTGFLGTGVHVAFVVVNHPGDIEIFAQGIIEGTVTDVVDGAVPGKHNDFGQHIVEAVGIGLIQGELGSQGRSRGGAETVVACLVNPGVEGVDQFRDLVAAGGIDGVNVKSAIDHMLDGPPVLIRENLESLVKGFDPLGAVAQTFQGIEGQKVDGSFTAAGTKGVLARIELGKDKKHLVVERHAGPHTGPHHRYCPDHGTLRGKNPLSVIRGLVNHFKGVHRTDLGADPAAFAAINNCVDVQGKTLPGNSLGRFFEDLEIRAAPSGTGLSVIVE